MSTTELPARGNESQSQSQLNQLPSSSQHDGKPVTDDMVQQQHPSSSQDAQRQSSQRNLANNHMRQSSNSEVFNGNQLSSKGGNRPVQNVVIDIESEDLTYN